MSPFDHMVRAANLRELIEQHAYKCNEEGFQEQDPIVDIECDPPVVPYRYAAATFDGRGTWMEFDDDLGRLSTTLAEAINGEIPWAPGAVMDLDSGEFFEAIVEVTLVAADVLAKAQKVLARLNAGEGATAALVAEGVDPDEVVSMDSSAFDLDDEQNNVLDFCANVLLRRETHVEVLSGAKPKFTTVWVLETY